MGFDIKAVRAQFPALSKPVIYFDNPGGTQIARTSLEHIQAYLVNCNANHGGAFTASIESDAQVEAARAAMADFLNAARPEEIIFGANMTTLTFHISRSLARLFQPGDTLVVTRLDHDGNISPWLKVAEDRGLRVRWVDIHPEDCTIDLADLRAALQEKPRLVAVGYASNAVGTINPVKEITRLAHEAGALVYIDAVQYAPHGPIDVQQLGCDFLVCSAYKFFGPHLGVLYGRYDLLDKLEAYRVRPAPSTPPGKFETGTGNFEHMAGLSGTLEYLQWIGETFGKHLAGKVAGQYHGRAQVFKQAMGAIRDYELTLSQALLAALQKVDGLHLYGITDGSRLHERVPTFSFTLEGWHPLQVAEQLARAGISVWDGNFYAQAVSERLELEGKGGMVRVGATHYNTLDEVQKLGEALENLRK